MQRKGYRRELKILAVPTVNHAPHIERVRMVRIGIVKIAIGEKVSTVFAGSGALKISQLRSRLSVTNAERRWYFAVAGLEDFMAVPRTRHARIRRMSIK
jgi:hypothetical protein